MLIKEVKTHVLVIGEGGAGLRAALEASSRGVEVMVVSKNFVEEPVTTSVIGGWVTHREPEEVREFFEDVLEEGNYINDQDVVWAFANEVPKRIPELTQFGVKMKLEVREEESIGRVRPIWHILGPPGKIGEGLRRPLIELAKSRRVKFLRSTMVTKLLVDENRVIGAVALDLKEQRVLVIYSKTVVLATGGGSGLYLKNDNPKGVTGDGYALALNAGAELVDMEFQIFSISPRQLCQIFSDNLDEEKVLFGTAIAHYTCGGVKIDPWGRTNLKGLYAAGEVAGGVFGSARLGGSAVADIITFGYRAGLRAAEEANTIKHIVKVPEQVEEEVRRIQGLLRGGRLAPQNVKNKLRSLMWRKAGPIRDERRLRNALNEVKEIREELEDLKATDFIELREALEVNFMSEVAEAMILSALTRKESRGSHWRIDYPRPDRTWIKNVFIFKGKDDEISVNVRDVDLKRAKPKAPFKIGERHTWCYIIM